MKIEIDRQFQFKKGKIVELRGVCFADDQGECLQNGKCYQVLLPPVMPSDFFAFERTRRKEIYFPEAPMSIRMLECHVKPLTNEELDNMEKTLYYVSSSDEL